MGIKFICRLLMVVKIIKRNRKVLNYNENYCTRIIEIILRKYTEKKLQDEQAVFLTNKRTNDNTHIGRKLIGRENNYI